MNTHVMSPLCHRFFCCLSLSLSLSLYLVNALEASAKSIKYFTCLLRALVLHHFEKSSGHECQRSQFAFRSHQVKVTVYLSSILSSPLFSCVRASLRHDHSVTSFLFHLQRVSEPCERCSITDPNLPFTLLLSCAFLSPHHGSCRGERESQ